MASTYSSLKIELIGTGEQAGTWGTTTNANLNDAALGAAITGSANVVFSGGDVTLTLSNTNTAQTARNLRLNLTGTSGGARNLILGSGCQINKLYLINNGLADAVTVKNTTGTGTSVAAGKTTFVFNDGTNVVEAVNFASSLSTGNLAYTGTLTGGTGVVNLGSGQFYKDASGNVGIGTASPSVRLDVAGFVKSSATTSSAQIIASNTGGLFILAKDSSTGGSFGTAYSSNLYSDGAYPMVFWTNGVERMRIDSSGNVLVGVTSNTGVDTGVQRLVVTGIAGGNGGTLGLISDSLGRNIILTDSSKTSIGSININTTSMQVGTNNNYPLVFNINGSERMRINSSGNVGIGTSSPATRLDVSLGGTGPTPAVGTVARFMEATGTGYDAFVSIISGNAGAACLDFGDTDATTPGRIQYFNNINALSFTVNSGERMRIDSSGSVCVGVTSSGWAVAGSVNAIGYAARAGQTGGFSGNGFNINWTGSAQLWIDTTNLGNIQLSSDYRIKRNVETQTAPAIERVMALRPVTYQMADYKDGLFKASDAVKEGFIAHEVQEVIPSGAEGKKDDETQIQSLRVDAILSVAIKAIQELKAELDSVKAELQTLKGN